MREVRLRTVEMMTRLSAADRQLQQSLVELDQQVGVGAAPNVLLLIRVFVQVIQLHIALCANHSKR